MSVNLSIKNVHDHLAAEVRRRADLPTGPSPSLPDQPKKCTISRERREPLFLYVACDFPRTPSPFPF